MNYWDKTKFFEKLLLFTWLAFLFSCLLFLSFTSHAAADQDYFPMSQNKNNKFTSSVITGIENQFDSTNYNIFSYWVRTQAQWNVVNVAFYPKSDDLALYGEKNNDLIHFSLYQYGSGGFQYRQLYIDNNGNIGGIYNAGIGDFQNLVSSNYSTSVDYVSNFQMYTNNSNTKKIVLLYDDGVTIPEDNTAREDTDKPNINNYLPTETTPPSFDDSSVEAALGSIFDYLQYETNKISGTISGIGEYLSDSIMWGLQMVINNIRSKITEMVNAIGEKIDEVKVGIGSKIDDIQDSIDYIIQPVDGDIIYDSISTTSLVGNFNIIKNSITTFQSSFENLSEPTEYKIPIHLENLNFPIFGTLTVQYIDLTVINPVKSIIRLMITALVTYSLVITIFDSISNYINGGGDE